MGKRRGRKQNVFCTRLTNYCVTLGRGMRVCVLSCFIHVGLLATLWTVHGILQARILEYVAMLSTSKGSSDLGIEPTSPVVPAMQVDGCLTTEPPGKPPVEVGWEWAPKTLSEEEGRWIKERLLKWAQSPGIKEENIRMSISALFCSFKISSL